MSEVTQSSAVPLHLNWNRFKDAEDFKRQAERGKIESQMQARREESIALLEKTSTPPTTDPVKVFEYGRAVGFLSPDGVYYQFGPGEELSHSETASYITRALGIYHKSELSGWLDGETALVDERGWVKFADYQRITSNVHCIQWLSKRLTREQQKFLMGLVAEAHRRGCVVNRTLEESILEGNERK